MHLLVQVAAWLVAAAWVARTVEAIRGLPTVPDLLLLRDEEIRGEQPPVAVIVPARNEERDIRACLRSLLAQDLPGLRIVAVNDRSTDQTGSAMDSLAAEHPGRLQVLHVTDLPAGWLGKTHAMALAAERALDGGADFLLFTDADILFREDALRRALALTVAEGADHLVVAPTTIIRRWDEAALLSFFQILGFWAVRPWKVADPRALRDAIGVGAFNLLRASAYRHLGGFKALQMEIVEDLALGRAVKLAGLRQRFAFGRGLVRVHWASGVNGIVNVMTKNIFAATGYRIWLLLLGCLWLYGFCIQPFFAVWTHSLRAPAGVTLAAIAVTYAGLSRYSTLRFRNVVFAPFAAAVFLYALLRSMTTTLVQGGVLWRGTFYPLADLRRHTGALFPRPRA